MNEPAKNHISSVVLNVFKTIKEFFFLFIVIIIKPSFRDIIIIGAIIILIIGYSFLKWYKTCFYIKDGILVYETGVLQKKILSLSMDKITTIDLSQNMVNKFFDTFRLKIDSGSVQTKGAEIDIVLKKNIAVSTRDILLRNPENYEKRSEYIENEWGRVFEASNMELLLTALTKNNLALGLGLFFSMYTFLDDILKAFNIKYMDAVSNFIDPGKIMNASIPYLILFIAEAISAVWIICIILSAIGTIIKFHGFKVYETNNNIKIEYGLINTKSYSLPIENVQAIILKQNIIKQKLGLYNIEISTVGYGNEAKEEAILYPIVSKRLMNELVSELIPEFQVQPVVQHAPRNTLTNFITVPLTISIVIFSIAALIYHKAIILFLLLPIILAGGYLNYKNSAIGFNNHMLKSVSGGFNRKIYIVRAISIQSVSLEVSPFQRRKKVGTYVLQYYASKLGDVVNVKNLSDSFFVQIKVLLLRE